MLLSILPLCTCLFLKKTQNKPTPDTHIHVTCTDRIREAAATVLQSVRHPCAWKTQPGCVGKKRTNAATTAQQQTQHKPTHMDAELPITWAVTALTFTVHLTLKGSTTPVKTVRDTVTQAIPKVLLDFNFQAICLSNHGIAIVTKLKR